MSALATLGTRARRAARPGRSEQPFEIADGAPPVRVTASVGVAVSATAAAGELLRSADVALYQAKHAGRNCFVLFQPEMQTEPSSGEELTAQLRVAVSEHQFHLVYQPIYDLGHLSMVGVFCSRMPTIHLVLSEASPAASANRCARRMSAAPWA